MFDVLEGVKFTKFRISNPDWIEWYIKFALENEKGPMVPGNF